MRIEPAESIRTEVLKTAQTGLSDFEPSLEQQILDIEQSRPETGAQKCVLATQERRVFGFRDALTPG
jgi:hypothetical protein